MPMWKLRLVLFVTSLMLVGCDHYTKHVARNNLRGRPPHALIGGVLDLSYVENTDSGFGLLRKVPVGIRTKLLTVMQLGAGIVFFLSCLRRTSSKSMRLALLLISAGALGNGLDRILRGYVVDFIHIHYWPVFNAADIYITVGAILLVWAMRKSARKLDDEPKPAVT
jgi:signal peptidase II